MVNETTWVQEITQQEGVKEDENRAFWNSHGKCERGWATKRDAEGMTREESGAPGENSIAKGREEQDMKEERMIEKAIEC